MTDNEKLISGLEHCVDNDCAKCPYRGTINDCLADLLIDTLEYIRNINIVRK